MPHQVNTTMRPFSSKSCYRSTRELEREKLAERLELSSREVTEHKVVAQLDDLCIDQVTEHEEAEWRCLDSTNPTQGWPTPRQVEYFIDFTKKVMLKFFREIFFRGSTLVFCALATPR